MASANVPSRVNKPKQCSIPFCEGVHRAYGYCQKHYKKLVRYGDPLGSCGRVEGSTPEERFWKRVNKNGPTMPHMDSPCWVWTRRATRYGYGQVMWQGKQSRVHRVAWELMRGEKPGPLLLHNCDNRRCVNPDHLREGTQKENCRDAIERGRHTCGEKHGMSKLTNATARQALQWRSEGISTKEISIRLGVAVMTIRRVVSGRSWTHLSR